MNLTTLRSQSRKYTKTNATNYADADVDADINLAYGEIWMMILEAEGYKNTSGDFKTTDLVSITGLVAEDIGFMGEYPFPSTALEITRAEISYDGINWYPAKIVEKTDSDSSEFNADQIYGDESKPEIWIFRDSYFIVPLHDGTTVVNGIKLFIQARQATLVNTSDIPKFETNFHNLIPLKVAQDFYLVHPDKYNPRIDKKVQELEAQVISFYESRTPYNPRLQTIKEKF